jgi:hypothetical protein
MSAEKILLAPPQPVNFANIRSMLQQRRLSVTESEEHFSEQGFERFRLAVGITPDERAVSQTTISILKGKHDDPFEWDTMHSFDNLEHLTDGTIARPHPDIYRGVRSVHTIREPLIRELSEVLQPTTDDIRPILPSFFMELKGATITSPAIAKLYACHSGAAGARGRDALDRYGAPESSPRFDNKAYVITSTYVEGYLAFYAVRPGPPRRRQIPLDRVAYNMSPIASYAIFDCAEQYRAGVCAFRNAAEWTHEEMMKVVRQANARYDYYQAHGHFEQEIEPSFRQSEGVDSA